MRTWLSALCVVVASGAAACGGSGGADAGAPPDAGADGGGYTFPAQPFLTLQSSSGQLTVALRSNPESTPILGENTVQYTITDESGAPEDGLTLTVVPWMPSMGHGTSAKPIISDEGGGVYLVQNVYLFMSGVWQLQTQITGPVTDSVAPSVDVQ